MTLQSLSFQVSPHFTHYEVKIQNLCDKNAKNSTLANVPHAPALKMTIIMLKYKMTESILDIDKTGHQVPEGVYGNGESNIIPFFTLMY